MTLALVIGAASPLSLSELSDGKELVARVWQSAPALEEARARMAQAEAERRKAFRLPNPGLAVSVNTLPVGPLNPPELRDPFLNVPNVAVGLSVLLELGKRGPRQEAKTEAARAVALEALEQLRREVLSLEATIGDVAAAQLRVDALTSLAADAQSLSNLQQARASKGDTSELDADRARLEQEGSETSLGEAQAELASALRACSEQVAAPCLPFVDSAQASTWLDRVEPEGPLLERRPDLRALEAARRSALAAQTLAAHGWLPDPTVTIGYLRDQFVASGNQQNSLFVGVSMPLPIFEHGADERDAAGVAARSAERARELLLLSSRQQLTQLASELNAIDARRTRLRAQSLPLARSVVERLAAATNRGAAPLHELLLARRTLTELLLTTTELDRSAFRLRVARARLTRAPDELPSP